MSEEEQSELFEKAFTNTLIKLAKEPEELFDNNKLRKKCNNLLREQIKLKKQLQQKDRIIKAAREYILYNCILSDEWTELDFCEFIPTGNISYKQLSSKKVKEVLKILDKENK